MKNYSIAFSAPGKIHLLGEHMVVYGKPALLATIDLRTTVTLRPPSVILRTKSEGSSASFNNPGLEDSLSAKGWTQNDIIKKTIESVVKKYLKIKTIPPYRLKISSQIPLGCGLGSSAAISASCIAVILTFLKVKWDLDLINNLTFEAERAFHGNPSGGDNSAIVYGGLTLYTKGGPVHSLPFSISKKITENFVLINTGKPNETTREMVELVKSKVKSQESRVKKIFDSQEQLVRELLPVIETGNEKKFIEIIREGEKNLERIGVVSPFVKSIIRKIEESGGAGKICGGGGKSKGTGVLFCFHQKPSAIEKIAKGYNIDYFRTALGVKGLRKES